MHFRIISIPPFKAVSSGVDKNADFSENGVLGKFDAYFSKLKPGPRDGFMPRDFLYYDAEKEGLVWMYALTDEMDAEGFEVMDFEGGSYLTYHYKDGDHEANERLYHEALAWIEQSEYFVLDQRTNHYAMGHIITPPEVIKATGTAQMEAFIPIRLKIN
ncbi:GyrI-like domain-containing protein [Paenibacillus timonensis]|uniref:GyrI-like domain-containing protein n=1 Tax=Paenibacillus timonensis TaxID=225915 RepID=UPI003F9C847B